MNKQEQFLLDAFYGYMQAGTLRSYMALGRKAGMSWFDSRGIRSKFNIDMYSFLKRHCFQKQVLTAEELEKFFTLIQVDIAEADEKERAVILKSMTQEEFKQAPIPSPAAIAEAEPEQEIEPSAEPRVMLTVERPAAPIVETPVLNGNHKPEPMPGIQVANVTTRRESTKAELNLVLPMQGIVEQAVADYINNSGLMEQINKQIMTEAAKLRPNIIKIGTAPEVKIEGKLHYKFERALQLVKRKKQLYISGRPGTGKTTLALQVAKALNLPFAHISCTAGMSEAHLMGRMVANGEYIISEFVNKYENGGVFLLDEVDAADANTLLIINSALANGSMSVPNRPAKSTAHRHADFYCICAANTWGNGSNELAGRNVLDGAFLDRFCGSKMHVDYDVKLEAEISQSAPAVAEVFWQMRKNVSDSRLRRPVSTRAIVDGVQALADGDTLKQFVQEVFLEGWAADEQKKALQNINL